MDEEKRLNRVWQRELLVWPRPSLFLPYLCLVEKSYGKNIPLLPEKLSVKLIPIFKSGFTHVQLYMLKEQQ